MKQPINKPIVQKKFEYNKREDNLQSMLHFLLINFDFAMNFKQDQM